VLLSGRFDRRLEKNLASDRMLQNQLILIGVPVHFWLSRPSCPSGLAWALEKFRPPVKPWLGSPLTFRHSSPSPYSRHHWL